MGTFRALRYHPKYLQEAGGEGEEEEEAFGIIIIEIGPKPMKNGIMSSLVTLGNQQNQRRRPGKTTTQ